MFYIVNRERYNEQLLEHKMKTSRAQSALPLPVSRALRKLGTDISVARRRRGISTPLMAERAFISRTTLVRVEKGDPSVSLGIYASVIFVLGMTERLANLLDPSQDPAGQALEEDRLPKRIRSRKSPEAGGHAT
jgi:DNA-binding XRE family transcriptional regulator